MDEQELQIPIQDLELSLEIYEIESEQKLEQLKKLFGDKKQLDLSKVFYEEKSSTEIKFQNIVSDLIQFLVKQQASSTQKLRKLFYRILQNPLLLLFKVSRFQILELRFNGFDIQLKPIEAIEQLGKSLEENIDNYIKSVSTGVEEHQGHYYKSWESFKLHGDINLIQEKIFVMYSYLRKGGPLLKKKFQSKIKIVELFTGIIQKILPTLLRKKDTRTLKELSILNYEIYILESNFDVLNYYLYIPLYSEYQTIFQQFESLAAKCQQSRNYDIFIILFVKYHKQILQKLSKEGIDSEFSFYIENCLKSILDIWKCGICHYQEFCDLFSLMFRLHSKPLEILKICLEQNQKIEVEEAALVSKNFQFDVEKKLGELLNLMHKKEIKQINNFMNEFYHKKFYNLNFQSIERGDFLSFLTLINGNSSFLEFFHVVERNMKQWNHSIDFGHPHKFLPSQFSYLKASDAQIEESFRLITNLCVLEQKGFQKEYEPFISSGAFQKIILNFAKFIAGRNDKNSSITQSNVISHFTVGSFRFLQKFLNPSSAEELVRTYSLLAKNINTKQMRVHIDSSISEYIKDNFQHFRLTQCIQMLTSLENVQIADIISRFMIGVAEKNKLTSLFCWFGKNENELQGQKFFPEQIQYLSKNAVMKNGKLQPLDLGTFKLTDLEIMTNPIQFEKVIDNYYFQLDQNSHKFIEYACQLWAKSEGVEEESFTQILKQLIQSYPICVPVLASLRIQHSGENLRFAEYLCLNILKKKGADELILRISKVRNIRYRNGKDYIKEEIIPMMVKVLLASVNASNEERDVGKKFLVLGKLLLQGQTKDYKLEMIQKGIEKIRYWLSISKDPRQAQSLASSHENMLHLYFKKKEVEMKREGLVKTYQKMLWGGIRNYASATNEVNSEIKDCSIPDQIIVTPFSIPQDFNLSQYKNQPLDKKIQVDNATIPKRSIEWKQLCSSLKKIQQPRIQYELKGALNEKKVDISEAKYNIWECLGQENIEELIQKQNVVLIEKLQGDKVDTNNKKNEQNRTLVQFYLKEFQIPKINNETILKCVCLNLHQQNESSLSTLWSNNRNLQNYFMDLLSVFQYSLYGEGKAQKSEKTTQILTILQEQPQIRQKVLKIFSKIGYSNIWGENLNIYWNNFPIRNLLGFSNQREESFLSIILKSCLQREDLKEDLTNFLGSLFQTRENQNVLMYKVSMDKELMNQIMKSLSISHLDKISLLFHSNFNNLRLYTDQLHVGMKSLNMASKNRNYNEYVKLSEDVDEEEFYGPMKLFKQNFGFFIRIEKEGYGYKKNQEIKLALDRITNIIRGASNMENISKKLDEILMEFYEEKRKLQIAMGNRVKSFYLVTKLRDLSFQNAKMIQIIYSTLKQKGKNSQEILEEIDKVEIFSLMLTMYNDLIRFQDDWKDMEKYSSLSRNQNHFDSEITICTTRRFSHSMSLIYEKCDLEFDEVLQRCFDELKLFFNSEEGQIWMEKHQIYPAFLIRSFIDSQRALKFSESIMKKMQENKVEFAFKITQKQLISDLISGLRAAPQASYRCGLIMISDQKGNKLTPDQILPTVMKHLIEKQTLMQIKNSKYLIINKYKTSQATLEQLEVLALIMSYMILNKKRGNLRLHPCLLAAMSFNIAHIDHLLDINFKVWEQLKAVLSCEDSASFNLNFSHLFEDENLKEERVQLVDKGSSKKVNNHNREEYCDLVCCYILYEMIRPQLTRMLHSLLSIIPKEYISCLSPKTLMQLFYEEPMVKKQMEEYMRKLGIIYPDYFYANGKKEDNLKDFQNIQWFQELVLHNAKTKEKLWKDETSIALCTRVSGEGSIVRDGNCFVIGHFKDKEQMKTALDKI